MRRHLVSTCGCPLPPRMHIPGEAHRQLLRRKIALNSGHGARLVLGHFPCSWQGGTPRLSLDMALAPIPGSRSPLIWVLYHLLTFPNSYDRPFLEEARLSVGSCDQAECGFHAKWGLRLNCQTLARGLGPESTTSCPTHLAWIFEDLLQMGCQG